MSAAHRLIRLRRMRSARRPSATWPWLRLGALGCSGLLSLLAALAGIGLAVVYAGIVRGLPSPEALPALLEPPGGQLLEPTRFYDRSGEHLLLALENPAARRRAYLSFDGEGSSRLPDALAKATVAYLEPAFWSDSGLSIHSLFQDGQPTLARRLVAELLLWEEPAGLRRALRERWLAVQVIARFGHEKVLEWYLNSADYGRLAFGADAAARVYFGKPASRLSLAEAAVLAAAGEAPALNPADAPRAALERQRQVLETMLRLGFIKRAEYDGALAEELAFRTPAGAESALAPAFTALALEQLGARFDAQRIRRGGLRVITTLDLDLQQQAACAASVQLGRLEGKEAEGNQGGSQNTCPAARLLPALPESDEQPLTGLSASVVVLDPASGQVLAMAGGGALSAPGGITRRPAGTLLTPFIYLSALTRGFSPSSLVWDIPPDSGSPSAAPRNPDGRYHGPQRLRLALANDYLVPAYRLLELVGSEQVWRTARQLGLLSLEPPPVQAAFQALLESSESSLLELTQAYGVFANQGVWAGQLPSEVGQAGEGAPLQPVTVLRVEEIGGRTWYDCLDRLADCGLQSRPVISQPLAYLVNHVLSDESARWPSLGRPNPLEIGRPAGAKIGRTAQGKDAWTIGYTPQRTVGVWMGSEKAGPSSPLPATASAGLWHAVMRYATRQLPAEGWLTPAGIVSLPVCDPSGMLPTGQCPSVVGEVFLEGNEPTHVDTLFRQVRVNRETGLLATVFTPPALIEVRTYMVVPAEAADWARQAGLPALPEAYDPIGVLPEPARNARITSPAMFARVGGRVSILGSAFGNGFDFYRLQIGQGFDPLDWQQLGEDSRQPVRDGQLGIWDTAGLEGLYTLQLLVIRRDQSVQTATLQLTVDNQPPQVSIAFPEEGQRIALPPGEALTFEIEAGDEVELAEIEFYLDDKRLGSLSSPPFLLRWEGTPGEHRLRVRALDRAGNASEAQVTFRVERWAASSPPV